MDAALHFGADAVYGGGKQFGLRAFSDNFNIEELADAVSSCHRRGRRFYYTLNAYLHQGDLAGLCAEIRDIAQSGVDAFLVSDPGVLLTLREMGIETEVHLSTQANALNSAAVRFWYQAGVKRMVLARECTLNDIRAIRAEIPEEVELETFVHGAMCIAYSGRCLLSTMINQRDGNRGACSQVCRRPFEMRERDDEGLYYPIKEDNTGTYVLNSRDINMIAHLKELRDAGVDSLKIEGRMKTAFYVATVVNAYRLALDDLGNGRDWNPETAEELLKIRHRPYSTGFFFADEKPEETRETQFENANIQTHEFVGVVLAYDAEAGCIQVEQRNRFFDGDALEVVTPGALGKAFRVRGLRDEEGAPLECARHPQQHVAMDVDIPLHSGDLLRKRII